MKCPTCGSQRFFVKDPEDEDDTHEFDLEDRTAGVCRRASGSPAGNRDLLLPLLLASPI